jgi:hypothetical protein
VGGIDGQRCQDREDRIQEVGFERGVVGILQSLGRDQHDSLLAQFTAQRGPVALLLDDELVQLRIDGAQLLRGREAVVAGGRDQLARLPG